VNSRTNPLLLLSRHESGGATIAVLGFVVVISLLFGVVLTRSVDIYRQVSHVASWQEALLAAEAGSDTAMAELRKTLFDPATAFAGWTTTALDGTVLPHQGKRFAGPTLIHGGEGNTELDLAVSIDTPPQLIDGSDRQWYRVRSTGTTYLSGGRYVTYVTADKRDHLLRRLSFRWDRKTDTAVTRPQSSRMVEILVKPTSFENAITSDLPIDLNNQKIIVDSYDSRYATKSTMTANGGVYPDTEPLKQQKNGDIATNSKLIDAGDATIKGDAFTNAGVIQSGANITGEQRNDFYQELIPIKKPSDWPLIQPTPPSIGGSTTFVGGTKAAPMRYKLASMNIEGTSVMTFKPSATGVESYIEVWVTGDLKTAGNGTIVVQPNANVKIFLEGHIDVKGNGTFNANSQPGRLQILGVQPPPGSPRNMSFSGNGVIVAAIYAPQHNVVFGATGSAGTMWGSLTGRSITMGGTTYIHYDEALADTGHITDFRIKSWFEDVR